MSKRNLPADLRTPLPSLFPAALSLINFQFAVLAVVLFTVVAVLAVFVVLWRAAAFPRVDVA